MKGTAKVIAVVAVICLVAGVAAAQEEGWGGKRRIGRPETAGRSGGLAGRRPGPGLDSPIDVETVELDAGGAVLVTSEREQVVRAIQRVVPTLVERLRERAGGGIDPARGELWQGPRDSDRPAGGRGSLLQSDRVRVEVDELGNGARISITSSEPRVMNAIQERLPQMARRIRGAVLRIAQQYRGEGRRRGSGEDERPRFGPGQGFRRGEQPQEGELPSHLSPRAWRRILREIDVSKRELDNGVVVRITSDNPRVVELIKQIADRRIRRIQEGLERRSEDLPQRPLPEERQSRRPEEGRRRGGAYGPPRERPGEGYGRGRRGRPEPQQERPLW